MKAKKSTDTSKLIHMLDQMDITDFYRAFHPTTMQYTFFSAAHGTFSKIDHILGHKESLKKFKKVEIKSLYYIRSQQNKSRAQQQKKPKKIFKYMATKQHS
jgi:exonuclease III